MRKNNRMELNRQQKTLSIISICFSFISLILILTKIQNITHTHNGSSMLIIYLLCATFFISIFTWYISKTSHYKIGSFLIVLCILFCASYSAYMWGVSLPFSILSFVITIILSMTLLDSSHGLFIVLLICIVFLNLGFRESKNPRIIEWGNNAITPSDIIIYLFIIFFIGFISWFSTKEIEKYFKRAEENRVLLEKERNKLEENVELRTKDLIESQNKSIVQVYKFIEFGKIATGIFHDILSPLNSISLIVENIKNRKNSNYEIDEDIDLAVSASLQLKTLIDSSRKSLRQSDTSSPFQITSEISSALSLLNYNILNKKIKVETALCPLPTIHSKQTKFFQVVINLLSNAIDSFEKVEVRNAVTERKIKISTSMSADNTVINLTVEDNGSGITPQVADKIFNPFFTTKDEKGIGLGLSIVKSIIEGDFGGKICFESEEGRGTKFSIMIPTEGVLEGGQMVASDERRASGI